MPPAPSADWMLYAPNRVPAVSRIALAYCVNVGWNAGPPAHRLTLPIRQRAPAPLERTESEMAQPDRTPYEVEDPNAEDDVIELIALQLSHHSQPRRVEDQRVDERMGDVVRERHLPHRCQPIGDPPHTHTLDEQDQHRGVAESHRHTADLIRRVPEHRRHDVEIRR